MTEIPSSKFDIKLFRRFPDSQEEDKEQDYGPGYIKLYDWATINKNGGIQVVFRSNGTMKVRAAHMIRATARKDNDSEPWGLDVSIENQLRYTATADTADMNAPMASYGREAVTEPINFPLAFEFHTLDERDKFVDLLRDQLEQSLSHQEDHYPLPESAQKDEKEENRETEKNT